MTTRLVGPYVTISGCKKITSTHLSVSQKFVTKIQLVYGFETLNAGKQNEITIGHTRNKFFVRWTTFHTAQF